MTYFDTAAIEVEKVENGWVLTWRIPDDGERIGWGGHRMKIKTRGREIFTEKKALLKRIEALI